MALDHLDDLIKEIFTTPMEKVDAQRLYRLIMFIRGQIRSDYLGTFARIVRVLPNFTIQKFDSYLLLIEFPVKPIEKSTMDMLHARFYS